MGDIFVRALPCKNCGSMRFYIKNLERVCMNCNTVYEPVSSHRTNLIGEKYPPIKPFETPESILACKNSAINWGGSDEWGIK